MTDQLEAEMKRVEEMIERVRNAGLAEEAEVFSNAYWGFVRTIGAYRHALPYVNDPAPTGCGNAEGVLHVTTYTVNFWQPKIPGCEPIDNEAVRREDRADEEWHRREDYRMRRDAGEFD